MLINESMASLFFILCVFIIRLPWFSFCCSYFFVVTVVVVVVVAGDYDDDSNDIRTVSGHRPPDEDALLHRRLP